MCTRLLALVPGANGRRREPHTRNLITPPLVQVRADRHAGRAAEQVALPSSDPRTSVLFTHASLAPRAAYGFRDDWVLYTCPQSVFKLHPEYDLVRPHTGGLHSHTPKPTETDQAVLSADVS